MILTIIGLLFLYFFHEMGHLWACKAVGVKVAEVSIGFGDRKLFSKELNGTVYSLKLICLGGYVKIDNSFRDVRPRTRIFVGLAGPAASLLFSFLLFTFISFVGLPELTTHIGTVSPGYPAVRAGLLTGDRVVAIEGHPVAKWNEMISLVNEGKDKNLRVTIQRAQTVFDVFMQPELKKGRAVLGITASGESVAIRYGLGSAMKGAQLVVETLKDNFGMLKHMVVVRKVEGVAGPVQILQIGAQQASFGIISFLNLLSLLNLSFVTLNFFPVLPFDGGIIAIAFTEAASGRHVNRRLEYMVNKVVVSIVAGLLVFNVLSELAKKLI